MIFGKYKSLESKQWGNLYNLDMLESLVKKIQNSTVSFWTNEMLSIAKKNNCKRILEIGPGSGETALYLANAGYDVTVLDFSNEVIELIEVAATRIGCFIDTVLHDARLPLPFNNVNFDIIYSIGLMEHFSETVRIEMLKQWRHFANVVISMVPNAASLCYRLGKEQQEEQGTWIWGEENPLYTQMNEFILAHYEIKEEYTIGDLHSLSFLSENDELRKVMRRLLMVRAKKGISDCFHQGYLLVTVGCSKSNNNLTFC